MLRVESALMSSTEPRTDLGALMHAMTPPGGRRDARASSGECAQRLSAATAYHGEHVYTRTRAPTQSRSSRDRTPKYSRSRLIPFISDRRLFRGSKASRKITRDYRFAIERYLRATRKRTSQVWSCQCGRVAGGRESGQRLARFHTRTASHWILLRGSLS